MSTTLTADVLQDDLAISLARAIAAANKKARELGIDVAQSLISIIQQPQNGNSIWQINYGVQDYINRRGGDVLVEVDMRDATIRRVLHGQ
ncbi:MAG: hypothetical protein M3R61_00860 [Chloroflexota bacterium]|nr:hypothetical protein [Chloroflexota bacterium]